jgi:pseudouridine kinase
MTYSEFSPSPEAPAMVIGSAGVDLVGSVNQPLQMGVSNPAHIRTSFGGVARNVAENLARLGQPVRLISAVGRDQNGERLVRQITEAGVDASQVLQCDDHPTGTYLAVVNSIGELQVAMDDMDAVAALTPEFLRDRYALFKDSSLLFIDANLPKDVMRTAISLARRARIPICADPTSTALANQLKPHLSKLFLITPNSNEAEVLSDCQIDALKSDTILEAAKCMLSQGVRVVIVTLAQLGVFYATSETSGQIPAINTEIADPTGGGDALTAAVLFALLNDIPLDDALRLGVSAATLTLRYSGTVLPDLTLERLYDQLVI